MQKNNEIPELRRVETVVPCPYVCYKLMFNLKRKALRKKFFFGISYLLGLVSLATKCTGFSKIHS